MSFHWIILGVSVVVHAVVKDMLFIQNTSITTLKKTMIKKIKGKINRKSNEMNRKLIENWKLAKN
jgi:hypothetical protein